jgi:hypothetical protein
VPAGLDVPDTIAPAPALSTFDLTSNADIPSSIEETSGGTAAGIYGNCVDQFSHGVASVLAQ